MAGRHDPIRNCVFTTRYISSYISAWPLTRLVRGTILGIQTASLPSISSNAAKDKIPDTRSVAFHHKMILKKRKGVSIPNEYKRGTSMEIGGPGTWHSDCRRISVPSTRHDFWAITTLQMFRNPWRWASVTSSDQMAMVDDKEGFKSYAGIGVGKSCPLWTTLELVLRSSYDRVLV
jgi:hypothetical protein